MVEVGVISYEALMVCLLFIEGEGIAQKEGADSGKNDLLQSE